MNRTADTLTDEQACQAAKLLFDLLPAEVWKDGEKPSPERVRNVVGSLSARAAPSDQAVIDSLVAGDTPSRLAGQAAIARLVLDAAEGSDKLAPYATTAIATAVKPDLCIDPITGTFVIALLLATTKIKKDEHGFDIELGAGAKDIIKSLDPVGLLKALPAVIKALPASVLTHLLGV
jgi:hypothetical protein